MKGSLLLILLCVATPVDAQTLPDTYSRAWRGTTKAFWLASVDYPVAASGGVSVVVGKERRIGSRGNTQLRGMIATAESGVGGFSGRLGYARLFQYDAGTDGLSVEAVYIKPWLLKWGLRSDEHYIGPGVTYRFGYLRVSGAAVVGVHGSPTEVRPTVTLGIVVPFRIKK